MESRYREIAATLSQSPWVIYLDGKEKLYFYHPDSNETVRKEPTEQASWKNNALDVYLKCTNWRRAKDDKGRVYYYNKTTRETRWNPPDDVNGFEKYLIQWTQKQYKARKSTMKSKAEEAVPTQTSSQNDLPPGEAISTANNTDVESIKQSQSESQFESQQDAVKHELNSQMAVEEEPAAVQGEDKSTVQADTSQQSQEERMDVDERKSDDRSVYDDDDYDMEGTPEQYSDYEQHEDDYDQYDYEETQIHEQYNESTEMNSEKFGDARGGDHEAQDQNNEENMDQETSNEEEIKTLASILSKRDSILEPDVIVNTKRLRYLTNENPTTTVKRLSDNYVGYAPMTNILSEWLMFAKILNEDASVVKVTPITSIAEQLQQYKLNHEKKEKEIHKMILQELSLLLKQKFDRSAADAIILQMSDIPSWLLAMMNDEILRKTLIELYNLNSDSTLLGFVLRQLSKLGFHNEIAHIIREFEYLDVFNDIIIDIMSRLYKAKNLQDIEVLVADIKKNCTGNEYLFLYTMELLCHLELSIIQQMNPSSDSITFTNSSNHSSMMAMANRIRRIAQELEDEVIWTKIPVSTVTIASVTSLMPPSVFALKLISVRSIFRRNGIETIPNSLKGKGYKLNDLYDLVMEILSCNSLSLKQIERLYKIYSIRPFSEIPSNDMDAIHQNLDIFDEISSLIPLLHHHHLVKIVIKTFIHPQSTIESKHLPYILALAAIPIRPRHGIGSYDSLEEYKSIETYQQNVSITKEACRTVLVKGLDSNNFQYSSQLSDLMANKTFSYMILLWIDFCNDSSSDIGSSSYLAVIPLFYHLIIQSITSNHQSSEVHGILHDQQPYCFHLLKNILFNLSQHSSSIQTDLFDKNDIVQRLICDGYDCIVSLMIAGYVLTPLQFIIDTIDNIDSENVRNLLVKLLQLKQPFSHVFLEKLSQLFEKASVSKEFTRRDMFTKLQEFHQHVIAGEYTYCSMNGSKEDDRGPNEGGSSTIKTMNVNAGNASSLRDRYKDVMSKYQLFVDKCKANFKY